MKKAFTMLELIMVIVVIGILAAVILPRTDSNRAREAATQLISHIRYTQHLAMIDDKFDSTAGSNWYRNLWQIVFNNGSYSIVSNSGAMFAEDPLEKVNIENIDISNDYGVVLTFNNCGTSPAKMISFDNMGRPMINIILATTTAYNTFNLMTVNTCDITVTGDGDTVVINIEPETGYAHIAP